MKKHSQNTTRVDLGDDLLEPTREVHASKAESPREPDLADQLQSAKILMGEGLLEEAKRILRKILIADPRRFAARELLREIHDIELKQLFGEGPQRKFRTRSQRQEENASEDPIDEVMRDLDQDFGPINTSAPPEGLEVARSHDELNGQNRIDLGIAFLEMGHYELAVRHFKAAFQFFLEESVNEASGSVESVSSGVLVATSLLAYALISAERPYEAAQVLQDQIQNSSISPENQLEFIYLMGRAYEAMNQEELAKNSYHQVAQVDPAYRDVRMRLERMARKQTKSSRRSE